MQFRVVTLNLEQDHKRWSDRHPLIGAEIAGLRPDVIAFNEASVPLQTARLLRDSAITRTGIPYKLVQQTRVNGLSKVEGEALLTRFAVVETGNLDYQARDIVALVARVVIEERPVDFYVTHLYMSRLYVARRRFPPALSGAAAPAMDRKPSGRHAGDRVRRL